MEILEEEFNKAMMAFKAILSYGASYPKLYGEINENTLCKPLEGNMRNNGVNR